MATVEETTGAHLELEHEDSLEDFGDVSKGDAGLLGVQVLWKELQPELENARSAEGHLLGRNCHVLLYPQALQYLKITKWAMIMTIKTLILNAVVTLTETLSSS